MAVFRLKVHLSRRNSATKFLYVKTVSNKVVTHFLAYLSVQNGCAERPFLPEISAENDPRASKTPNFS